MTPNNIVNMARLKGLDAIAVCDHNCAANAPAVERVAREAGLCFLPGIEMTTMEEVHVLAFFKNAREAEAFGEMIYAALPDIPNNEEYFGRQLVMDERDTVIGKKEKLLISALPYDIGQCCALVEEHGGVVVPAHVNKDANSILANLGFFPPQLSFHVVEVVKGMPMPGELAVYEPLHSSDAHVLWQISERENKLEVRGEDTDAFLKKFV